jgi:hypothetical protein
MAYLSAGSGRPVTGFLVEANVKVSIDRVNTTAWITLMSGEVLL